MSSLKPSLFVFWLIVFTMSTAVVYSIEPEANKDHSSYVRSGMGKVSINQSQHELGRGNLELSVWPKESNGYGFGVITDSTSVTILQEMETDTCYAGLFGDEAQELIEGKYITIITWNTRIDYSYPGGNEWPLILLDNAVIVLLDDYAKHRWGLDR